MSWNATPERPMSLLYDGSCRFCIAGSERLMRMARPGVIRKIASTDEAAMARFPASVRAALGGALQLVSADGDVASGAEAVNRALATRGVWRTITWLYFVPGVRQFTDWLYRIVARNRYRIMGKAEACAGGACKVPE